MYRKGKEKDKQDILDFLNYVFSMDHEPTDFRKLIPKVYGEQRNMEDCHHLLIEENKIKAAIGVYPSEMIVGNCTLKTGYIGSVSVHPYERHRGYMKDLMKEVQKDIRKEKYDLVALSGQRQRYEHFGFYRGGTVLQYQIGEVNLRHYFDKKFKDAPMSKEKVLMELELAISLQESNDDDHMDAIYQIYQNRIVTGRRREAFFDIMRSFHTELYAVTMHGVCIGYIAYDYEEDYINEFELLDMDLLPYVLEMLMEYTGCSVMGIKTTFLDNRKNRLLATICERYTIGQAQMYHILNYPNVCRALLLAKQQVQELCDGEFILEIKEEGKFFIMIKNREIVVQKTKKVADVTMTEEQFVRILLSTDYEMACMSNEIDGLSRIPGGWFPLPLAIEIADTF